jgi:hypothetical protein
LEAVFNGQARSWGAVGFRNGATDSPADKRWVKNKFSKDLSQAKIKNPVLDHFVFFTNIDLTPSEVNKLQLFARSSGIVVCDIFFRERIRMLLDSAEGLALRYQYLGIEMSSPEQAAFFARFGNSLQDRFDDIDRKLARIEFHSECARPTRYVGIGMWLGSLLRSDEIADLVLLAVVVAERKPAPHPTLCISAVVGPDYPDGDNRGALKSEVTVWAGCPPKRVLQGGQVETFPARDKLTLGLAVDAIEEFLSVADFDGVWLHLYANQETITLGKSIELIVNGYVLAKSDLMDLSFEPARPDDEWLRYCLDDQSRGQVLENVEGPLAGTSLPPFAFTDFGAYLPFRIDD